MDHGRGSREITVDDLEEARQGGGRQETTKKRLRRGSQDLAFFEKERARRTEVGRCYGAGLKIHTTDLALVGATTLARIPWVLWRSWSLIVVAGFLTYALWKFSDPYYWFFVDFMHWTLIVQFVSLCLSFYVVLKHREWKKMTAIGLLRALPSTGSMGEGGSVRGSIRGSVRRGSHHENDGEPSWEDTIEDELEGVGARDSDDSEDENLTSIRLERTRRQANVPIPRAVAVNWFFMNMSWVATFLATALFWVGRYDKGRHLEKIDYMVFGANLGVTLVDSFFTAHPFYIRHMWIGMLYAASFVVLSLVLYAADVERPTTKFTMRYSELDWGSELGDTAVLCVLVIFVGIPAIQIVLKGWWGLGNKLTDRDRLLRAPLSKGAYITEQRWTGGELRF